MQVQKLLPLGEIFFLGGPKPGLHLRVNSPGSHREYLHSPAPGLFSAGVADPLVHRSLGRPVRGPALVDAFRRSRRQVNQVTPGLDVFHCADEHVPENLW